MLSFFLSCFCFGKFLMLINVLMFKVLTFFIYKKGKLTLTINMQHLEHKFPLCVTY